ncbi:hypothetical protein Tco_0980013 [Tanacetum coccineum]
MDHDGVALCLRRRLHALRTIFLHGFGVDEIIKQYGEDSNRLWHLQEKLFKVDGLSRVLFAPPLLTPKKVYKDPDDGHQRFLLELEFVQSAYAKQITPSSRVSYHVFFTVSDATMLADKQFYGSLLCTRVALQFGIDAIQSAGSGSPDR